MSRKIQCPEASDATPYPGQVAPAMHRSESLHLADFVQLHWKRRERHYQRAYLKSKNLAAVKGLTRMISLWNVTPCCMVGGY
jgi:hypothetical protein